MVFSVSKKYIRDNDALYMVLPQREMHDMIYASFLNIDREYIRAMYRHCGYH